MLPNLNSIASNQNAHYSNVADLDREAEVTKLIGSEWFIVPLEEDLDRAFSIAKTIESSVIRNFMLSDICNAYLKLSTLQGCKKAFQVAQYKEEQVADIRNLLNVIVGVCLRLQTAETLSLAGEIFESYPKQMALSEHKNEFFSKEAQLEKLTPNTIVEPKTPNGFSKKAEAILIKKGDLNAILGRDAKNLVKIREFRQAIQKANCISDEISRDGVLAEIFINCCTYGDEEALGFAFEIAKNNRQYRDSYIFSIIETCKKLKNKESALKFAEEIHDSGLKEKYIRKIKLWNV